LHFCYVALTVKLYGITDKEGVMKISCVLLFIVALVALTAGCSTTLSSSEQEAFYVIEHQPDFQKIEKYFSVRCLALLGPTDPVIKGKLEENTHFVHEVIYRTKSGSFKLVLLDDNRPPKIISEIEFK